MFMLKKVMTPFLFPPGIFIVILLIWGIWLLSRKQGRAGIVAILIGCCIWSLCIGPVSDALLSGLESGFSIPAHPEGDVIVLLGGGVYDNVPDMTGEGAPSEDEMARMVTAIRLQKRLRVPVIIAGGGEALIVKRFLEDLDVPANKIIVEDRSLDTIENARYVKSICEKERFRRPLLVTSAYHMKRSVLSFKKVGMAVTPFPAQFKTGGPRKRGWQSCLPGDFRDSDTALHEYLGLLFYALAY
jgi:uncharacterized SAM-binding protein YcdF (DUF218 family)